MTNVNKSNQTLEDSMKKENCRLTVAMFVPGMAFDGNSLLTQSLGGSETAGLSMARELAALGHDVFMFNNCEKSDVYDGVTYMPAGQFLSYVTTAPVDVVIAQRSPEVFGNKMTSKLNLLWQHDLALLRQAQGFRSALWNVDKVMTVSQYMTDQYKKVYEVPDNLMWTTRNGIDLGLFPSKADRAGIVKNTKRLVYAARPERGLDVLLNSVFPKILERDKDVELVVCGYDNTTEHMAGFYQAMHQKLASFGDRAKWMGHLNKKELYELYATSGAYVYPTPSPMSPAFTEVSCITAMECMASGLPFVSSARGALPETLNDDACILIDGDPSSEAYQNRFADEVVELINDAGARERMGNAGIAHAQSLSWKALAEEWSTEMVRLIKERNDSPERLAMHFINHSDIFAAEKVISGVEGPVADGIRATLEDKYGFRHTPEALTEHYSDMGEVTDERLSKTKFTEEQFDHTGEKRFHLIEEFLKSRPDLENILDYGCGHGWHDIYMERRLGRKWTGLDIDPGAVTWSRTFAEKFAKNPENVQFFATPDLHANIEEHCKVEWSEKEGVDLVINPSSVIAMTKCINDARSNVNLLSDRYPFDCAIMSEVLEHAIDPVSLANQTEAWVKKGGTVIITVPYGPREYDSYKTVEHRNHLHEIDMASLREMFGDKPDLEVLCVSEGRCDTLDDPVGFYFIRYTADHKPVGQIDWERKLTIQRPRQTVSLSMICGPKAEETLDWCLASVKHVADEKVIADCGMSDEAKAIAEKHGVKVVQGKDPKQVGFDEARNVALPHLNMDWVLWIDSDERMTDPQKVAKYLRENIYHGYSVRQHHFAVDTVFNADMPVRFFRNRPCEVERDIKVGEVDAATGEWKALKEKVQTKLKFFGSIHEHPETGINEGPGSSIIMSDVHIAHVGYLAESGRRVRFGRNNPLLAMSNEKYPNRRLNKHFIIRDNMLLCTYGLETNGGAVTDEMRERCEETIDLFRKHFLGEGSFVNVNAIDYYSQACRFLGIGAEVALCVNASKDDTPTPDVKYYRFANKEDLTKELEWRAENAMAGFESEWY